MEPPRGRLFTHQDPFRGVLSFLPAHWRVLKGSSCIRYRLASHVQPALRLSVSELTEQIRQQPSGVFKTPSLPPSESRPPKNPTITASAPTTIVPRPVPAPDLEKGPAVHPNGNNSVPEKEANKDIQPRRTYLPLFLSNFIHRIAGVILWFIPQSIQRWWSPLHSRRPIGENTANTLFSSDVVRPRTSLIACPIPSPCTA